MHGPNESRGFAHQDREIQGTRVSIQAIVAGKAHIRQLGQVIDLPRPPLTSTKTILPAGAGDHEAPECGAK